MYKTNPFHFDLYHVFQPIVDLSANQVLGYEMLLRSEKMGTPAKIFQWAEEENRLFDLDMYSINKAFDTINERKSVLNGFRVFINVLPSTIENPSYVTKLKKMKFIHNPDLSQVVFEITEQEKSEQFFVCKAHVGSVQKQGFLIALDDLKKGDFRFSHVTELKPNVVKLDRYFSSNLSHDLEKQEAIQGIVQFIGDETMLILEGLEEKEDVEAAKKLGIRFGQGFVLGKPKPLSSYLPDKTRLT